MSAQVKTLDDDDLRNRVCYMILVSDKKEINSNNNLNIGFNPNGPNGPDPNDPKYKILTIEESKMIIKLIERKMKKIENETHNIESDIKKLIGSKENIDFLYIKMTTLNAEYKKLNNIIQFFKFGKSNIDYQKGIIIE